MLDRHDPPRSEALAVPDAVDLENDRDEGIAWQNKVAVKGMGGASLDGARGCDQRLRNHLAAENPLPAVLRRLPAKYVDLDCFKIETRDKIGGGGRHAGPHTDLQTKVTASRVQRQESVRNRAPALRGRFPRRHS